MAKPMDKKGLRQGISTGSCAAAAAKAATLVALGVYSRPIVEVPLRFPDGQARNIPVHRWSRIDELEAMAGIIKDAGDDPDITHGAEITARVRLYHERQVHDETPGDGLENRIEIVGGKGVGIVTKPGLPVAPGKPAINPVPRQMITQAVLDVIGKTSMYARVTIEVPNGEKLARKTLNRRLGIVGGISILGTTGIVKPISSEAWCATISLSMNVAVAEGIRSVVLATGRTSESAAQGLLDLPEEAFITMGDYAGFSFKEAGKRDLDTVYLSCQWSKLLKMAMGWTQTHVRHGALKPEDVEALFYKLFPDMKKAVYTHANTVREIFNRLDKQKDIRQVVFRQISHEAYLRLKRFLKAEQRLIIFLCSYGGDVINIYP